MSKVRNHAEDRLRTHLMKRHKVKDRGSGLRRFPSADLTLWAIQGSCGSGLALGACLGVKNIGKPCAGNRERTGRNLLSTLPFNSNRHDREFGPYDFDGIETILERHEEEHPLAQIVRIVHDACLLPTTASADGCLKDRLTHLRLFRYRAALLGDPWNPLAESLEAFEARGARPKFREDTRPIPALRRSQRGSCNRSAED